MSSTREFLDRPCSGEAPEKSSTSFAQTCNRLSRFIKEKGSLRDHLGLLEISAGKLESKAQNELLDLFPRHAGIGCPRDTELDADAADNTTTFSEPATMETEPKSAPLTIIYEGKVFVFDNFPAEKVEELILLGSSGSENCPSSSGFTISTPVPEIIKTSDSHAVASQPGPTSDIPIARRASLHRFFDKRKDRVASKAPYQVHGGGGPSSTSSHEHKELFDLNL